MPVARGAWTGRHRPLVPRHGAPRDLLRFRPAQMLVQELVRPHPIDRVRAVEDLQLGPVADAEVKATLSRSTTALCTRVLWKPQNSTLDDLHQLPSVGFLELTPCGKVKCGWSLLGSLMGPRVFRVGSVCGKCGRESLQIIRQWGCHPNPRLKVVKSLVPEERGDSFSVVPLA